MGSSVASDFAPSVPPTAETEHHTAKSPRGERVEVRGQVVEVIEFILLLEWLMGSRHPCPIERDWIRCIGGCDSPRPRCG